MNSHLDRKAVEAQLKNLIQKLEIREKNLTALSKKFSWYRLAIFLGGVFVTLLLFFFTSQLLTFISFIFFLTIFAIAAHFHGKLDRGIKRLKTWTNIKSTHLARMNLDWKIIPKVEYKNSEDFDPIEVDLNITGSQSLHQLIDTTISVQGSNLLREWLLNLKPDKDEIIKRQQLVKDLIPLVRLRDKLSLTSAISKQKEFDGTSLLEWIQNFTPQKSLKTLLIVLSILALVNIALFVLYIVIPIPAYWMITLLIYIAIYYFGNSQKKGIFEEIEFMSDELSKFSSVLGILESYPYPKNSDIINLCSCYFNLPQKPSALLSKIESSVSVLRMRKGNPFIWTIIRGFFPIDYFYTNKVNQLKDEVAGNLPEWLSTFYFIDALNALANFSYLNPDYTFPEISSETQDGKIINSEQLGHPLIRAEKKITNDFTFLDSGKIVILTGSNMSGKSTFLRALGINILLAYAGAPVNAKSMNLPLLKIFTCIKVSDSVIDGISYFYAEVKRLKTLLDLIEEKNHLPIFFLIDEIFRGTNNIERLKGSRAFIKSLSKADVIGAIATHDLELIRLSDEINNIKNYHFKEDIKNDKMIFDYKIQKGPCPTTNALKIMSMEGLPVE